MEKWRKREEIEKDVVKGVLEGNKREKLEEAEEATNVRALLAAVQ